MPKFERLDTIPSKDIFVEETKMFSTLAEQTFHKDIEEEKEEKEEEHHMK